MQVLVKRPVSQYACLWDFSQECVLKRTVGWVLGISNFEYETD